MVYASDFARTPQQRSADQQQKCSTTTVSSSAARSLVDTHDPHTRTGVQFLVDRTTAKVGYGVDTLRRALEALERGATTDHPEWRDNICAIDLNFGCPSPSIMKRWAGPAQLRRHDRVRLIFEALREWQQSTTVMTNIQAIGAKIRLGRNEYEQVTEKVHVNVAGAALEAGLDYLTVHAKHAFQKSRDAADWQAIAEIKYLTQQQSSNRMAVIGNGNAYTTKDVRILMEETQCDGVMVGRAAMQNPWIFRNFATKDDDGSDDQRKAKTIHNDVDDGNGYRPTPQQVRIAQARMLRQSQEWYNENDEGQQQDETEVVRRHERTVEV
jgi:tRNA-dihydrouridine synthase